MDRERGAKSETEEKQEEIVTVKFAISQDFPKRLVRGDYEDEVTYKIRREDLKFQNIFEGNAILGGAEGYYTKPKKDSTISGVLLIFPDSEEGKRLVAEYDAAIAGNS